jgi:hypothetical protein
MPSRIAMPIGLDPPVKGPETPTRMGSMAEAALATRIIDAKTILSRRPGKGVSLFFVMVACQRRGGHGRVGMPAFDDSLAQAGYAGGVRGSRAGARLRQALPPEECSAPRPGYGGREGGP